MPMKMIGQGLFVNTSKILGARIYQKDAKFRVAFTLDAAEKENQVIYSMPSDNEADCVSLIQSLDIQ
tara:strand:+ start:346 stop:546 length:201 start_codon:yes stop_codon:yes gene_type:complete